MEEPVKLRMNHRSQNKHTLEWFSHEDQQEDLEIFHKVGKKSSKVIKKAPKATQNHLRDELFHVE